ncbi:hypothetical protein J18TS1_21530 [Oceanobacillus oncorhynchi subsp. incaldanensis]|uniref:hypothetical protein n=1 Tax=Oceanobacillus oncorhynchi TaxID=545501 RepID=UPI001AFCF01E|nr:hypothetical protein [Oceanobacillus oncorhynchi]GIO19053.1 hypothetical protein J18TS1_21530 [Oceanobacillus oncorhynchi subsp. incaldanensis]
MYYHYELNYITSLKKYSCLVHGTVINKRVLVMREQVTREKIIFQSPAKDHERIIFVFISYDERYQQSKGYY